MKPSKHIVSDNEDLALVAAQHGYAKLERIWDAPENAALRAQRKGPHQLAPGDAVVLPPKTTDFRDLPNERPVVFRLERATREVEFSLLDEAGKGRAGIPCKLLGGGKLLAEVTTDADGRVQAEVPGSLRTLTIQEEDGSSELVFGHVNPLREVFDGGASGVAQRLRAMGYDAGALDGSEDEKLGLAVHNFRKAQGLAEPEDGSFDEPLLEALERAYGQ